MASGDTNVTNLVASGTITASGMTVGGEQVLGDDLQVASADGAITVKNGIVVITKGTAAALTLAAPTATTDDYKRLTVVSTTAAAHTVTQTTPGFNNLGASGDVGTYGAAAGNTLVVIAYQGVWYTENAKGVTIA